MIRRRVAVLASHTGSNLRALVGAADAPGAPFEIALVASNNSDAPALFFAASHGIPTLHLSRRTHPDPADLDAAMLAALRRHTIALVVTAGYLRKIGPRTLAAYVGRIVNVHPSLLPRHGGPGMYGRAVHEAVLASGAAMTGASVHVVTAEYDQGPVIAQRQVPVRPDDTVEALAARVQAVEHPLLCEVVGQLAGSIPATEQG